MKRLDNKGFTFIEMLASLFIFTLISFFIFHATTLIKYHKYSQEILDQMEWEVFLNQTKREVRSSEKIRLTYNRILLYTDTRLVLYEKYGSFLRRRVDGKGHEILLYNIRSFNFEPITDGVKIKIHHKNGRLYEEELYLPKKITVEIGS